ncbi:type II secretion system secretin GspD [Parasphingopyxis algicola]|uniref:type II secretion system secretin GspD n=1 Tax=Parasphingopyxis algicola TaxID=2026624 RepID=UPI0015A09F09|nr:type II secretion system secretin GspD [Parasphingopyxis algicola]QLC23881.1 type II secretion system secretin GspD [Parasphingopyxis algicola]
MKKITTVLAAMAMLATPIAPLGAQHVLNLRNADVRAFIQDASRVTGRTFVIDPSVSGTVTVVTDRPLSQSEYFEVFLSTLRANGLVAIPTAGGALRIQSTASAAGQPGAVGTARTGNNAFVTEIFRLRNVPAASAVETLRPLVSQEGSITANTAGNSLVIADFADNVRRMRALIDRVDVDSSASEIVALDNAGAREIAASLQGLVSGGEGPSPASVVPVDSSNSLVLRGDPATVARMAALARELDTRAASGTEIRVIFLEFADAGQILPVLERVTGQVGSVSASTSSAAVAPNAGEGGSGGGSAEAAGGRPGQRVIVTGYEGANAIIISAPPEMQRTLGELVRQLDTRRDQVLVEAIIVEISDAAARELGVQFLFGGEDAPFAVTNYSNVQPRILDIAGGLLADEIDQTTTVINGDVVTTTTNSAVGDLLRENAARSILGARGGFLGFASELGSDLIFGAILNAVQEDTDSNVLSTPSITTLDNQEASILVGQEIPISTGEALSDNFDNAFRTIQRENVGIELEVRPQINAGGAIRLDIRQEVSSIAGPVSDDFNELIINKREIETTVTVNDSEIIALGGLLDDNERRTIQRIPILGDIPIIGELFRSRARTRTKTNLMVFIRPTILSSADDRRAVMERRYGYIRARQFLADPDREPGIDTLVRQYLGVTPPGRPPANPPPVDPSIIVPDVSTSSSTVRPVPVPEPEEPQP